MHNEKNFFFSLNSWILIYLCLPCLIFILYWIRAPISAIFLIFFFLSFYAQVKVGGNDLTSLPRTLGSARDITFILLFVGILALLSGAGGYVIQRGDWTKHNVITNDLMKNDWPVNYGAGPYVKETTLVYYLAYYLPPALVGKYFGGWDVAQVFAYIYTYIGIGLFVLGVFLKFKKSKFAILVLFLVSGADILGNLLFTKTPISFASLETYTFGLQVPSYISQLTWAPQHTISAWLFAYLIFDNINNKYFFSNVIFYFAISLFWSPFVSASIMLFSFPYIFEDVRFGLSQFWTRNKSQIKPKNSLDGKVGLAEGDGLKKASWREFFGRVKSSLKFQSLWIANLIFSGIFSLAVLLFFKSQVNVLKEELTFYWFSSSTFSDLLFRMIAFLCIDVLIFLPIFIGARKLIDKADLRMAFWSITLLCIIPQFRYGAANDWLIRTTPLIFTLLSIVLVKNLHRFGKFSVKLKTYLIIVFIIGAITPISQIVVMRDISNPATNEQPDRDMLQAHLKYGLIHQQYMGSATKIFGRFIGNYRIK